MHEVFAKVDELGRVEDLTSGDYLPEGEPGWQKVDEGEGDRYHHAQGNYLPGPLRSESGQLLYKLSGDSIKKRSKAELEREAQVE